MMTPQKTVQLRPIPENLKAPLIEKLQNVFNPFVEERLNVVGGNDESENTTNEEKRHSEKYSGSPNYWKEGELFAIEKDITPGQIHLKRRKQYYDYLETDAAIYLENPEDIYEDETNYSTDQYNPIKQEAVPKLSPKELQLLYSIQDGAAKIAQGSIEHISSEDDTISHFFRDQLNKIKTLERIINSSNSSTDLNLELKHTKKLRDNLAILYHSYMHQLKPSKSLSQAAPRSGASETHSTGLESEFTEKVRVREHWWHHLTRSIPSFAKAQSKYIKSVNELMSQKVFRGGKILEPVDFEVIHKIANYHHQEKGVWRVRNHYVENIQERSYLENDKKYNLVNEKQFNLHMLLDNELTAPSDELSKLDVVRQLLYNELKDDALRVVGTDTLVGMERIKDIQGSLTTKCLNVVGEDHNESSRRRKEEKIYCAIFSGSPNYWMEEEFTVLDQKPEETDQLGLTGSMKVHEAANNSYQQKGVWKIREEDVDQIKKEYKNKDEIKSNLIHQSLFNQKRQLALHKLLVNHPQFQQSQQEYLQACKNEDWTKCKLILLKLSILHKKVSQSEGVTKSNLIRPDLSNLDEEVYKNKDVIEYNLIPRDVFNQDMEFGLNFAIMLVLGKQQDMDNLKRSKWGYETTYY